MVASSASWLAAAACLAAASAVAGSAQLGVTARIPELAHFRVVAVPPVLEITPEDVRRGQVDVAVPSVVAARTNIPGGFTVRVLMDPQVVTAATVTGMEQPEQVAGGFGLLHVPGPLWQERRYELHWRLQLAPQVEAGRHAWPVEIRLEGF